jgi:hypothetical protein
LRKYSEMKLARLAAAGEALKELERFAIAHTGAAPRVVYSRTFPSLTKPQTGRLNKSPHTVHAIANRHRRLMGLKFDF